MALVSCGEWWTSGPRHEIFQIKVDSIVVADSVGPNDTLFIGLRGIITTDACASFDHYDRVRTGGTIKYTVYGLLDDSKLCVATLVLLRKTDTVLAPQVNPTVITANNPGGLSKTRTVLVK